MHSVNGSRILDGIRVLELGRIVAAPTAGQILADLGADVVKVERPGAGDDGRRYGPVFARDEKTGKPGDSAYYLACNRNKRSITVDLSKPEGQQLIRSLVKHSDVVIENYKVGDLAAFGLDYESLKALKAGLIYCSLTGYGQTGPYADRPGLDTIFQAQSGLMSVTGLPDGVPGAGPMQVGIVAIDVITGYNAAMAVLAALLHRERTGVGQSLDIALFDSAVALMSHAAQQYLVSGESPKRHPTMGVPMGPAEVFQCADGPALILGTRDAAFEGLCRVLGVPELSQDPRFRTSGERFRRKEELRDILAPLVKRWRRQELLDALGRANVSAGPVNDMADVFADPQVRARGMAQPLADERYPDLKVVGSPLRFGKTPVRYERAPPALGENTDAVLAEILGLGGDEISALRSRNVI